LRPLDDVRDQIRARVERNEAARLAREAGLKKLTELSAKPDLAGFEKPRTVSRSNPNGLPAGALNAVMQVPAEKLPTFVAAELDGGAYGVFQVVGARAPAQVDSARREQLAQAWQQTLGAGDDVAYLDALKNKYKAEILVPELKRGIAPSGEK
jgi:peptidyl-prolyl cis-trans isomerase D